MRGMSMIRLNRVPCGGVQSLARECRAIRTDPVYARGAAVWRFVVTDSGMLSRYRKRIADAVRKRTKCAPDRTSVCWVDADQNNESSGIERPMQEQTPGTVADRRIVRTLLEAGRATPRALRVPASISIPNVRASASAAGSSGMSRIFRTPPPGKRGEGAVPMAIEVCCGAARSARDACRRPGSRRAPRSIRRPE